MKTAMSKGGTKRIRVGIIGANPDRGWAAQAHIPALKSLSHDFQITALSTSRRESADAASKLFDVPVAFDNHQDLVNSTVVDVVAVTVKVPYHLELAAAALGAGKAVYCEWPLGNGLNEAEILAALAKKQGVLAVAGLQARSAPAVAYVRDLVEQGYVGEVLSTTLVGSGRSTAARATCSSPPPAARRRSGSWTSAAARARSPRSRSCPCRRTIGGRRPKPRALPPTSPRPMRTSPATTARERTSAPPSKTQSRATACWTQSRHPPRPVSVKRSPEDARRISRRGRRTGVERL